MAALLAVVAIAVSCFDQPLVVGPGPIVAVFVGPDTTNLRLGQQVQLQAAPLDSTAAFLPHRAATWSSSDPAVASVDEDGLVTGLAPGSATITADVEGIQGSAAVVVDLPPSIGLSSSSVPFSATAGTDAPQDSVFIANTGGFSLVGLQVGTIAYEAGAADWLGAVLRADTAPTVLLLTPSTATITASGTYRATIPVQSVDAANSPFDVQVELTVSADAANNTAVETGDAQTAAAGLPVPVPPAVRVVDQYGNGVPGVDVRFAVTAGGGSVTGESVTTGPDGTAAVGSWTLGTGLGMQTLEATFPGSGLPAVTFTVTAVAGAPTQVNVSAGDGQTAVAGQNVTMAPVAIVLDQFGIPVPGVGVTFSVVGGGGSITAPTPQTDGGGLAQVGSWTLGTVAGANALRAVVAGVTDEAVFGATGVAGLPATVVISAGDGQTATVNTTVGVAPAVLVTDANGNPVPSASVGFTPQTGSVTGGAATTGTNGIATVGSWRLSTNAVPQQLTATVTGSGINGNPRVFTATATPDVAAALVLVSGDGQSAAAGTAVGIAPTVRVTDQFGNAVAGVQVTFRLTSGGGSITDSVKTSDAGGLASLGGWILGGTVGTNTVEAVSAGLNGSPLGFTATGISGAAENLVYVSGDAQTDTIGATLAAAYTVQVTDLNSNGVADVPVAFEVLSGGGSITPSVTTDANGFAGAQRVLGTTAGPQTARAVVGGLNGSPVQFGATANPGQPAAVFMVTGNGQSATVATAVATDPAVRVEDRAGNVIQGVQVGFVAGGGGGNGSVSGGTQSTGSDGVATVGSWTLGTTAGTSNNSLTATATGTGITNNPLVFTASGTPDVASLANSLVDATEPITASSGGSVSTVTVTVRDQFGNGRSGETVTIAVTSTGNAITQPAATTNGSGVATGSWSTTQAVVKTVSATIVGLGAITNTDDVSVSPDVASAAQTTIVVDDANVQASNTGSAADFRSVATVTVLDQFGNPRLGDVVTFTPSDANDFWRVSTVDATLSNAATTDVSGVASRVFYSTLAEGKTLNASVGGAFNEQIGITVRAAAPASVVATGGTNQTVRVGSAVGTVSFTVRDAFTNLVSGQVVTYSVVGGGSTPASSFTNASGVASATGWTMGSTGTENANGTFTNTLTATAGLAAGNATGFGIYTFSGDVLPIIQNNCDGCHDVDFRRSPNNIVGVASTTGVSCDGVIRVTASNAGASLLYTKLTTAPPCGVRMPQGGPFFTAATQAIFRTWINNGAQNN